MNDKKLIFNNMLLNSIKTTVLFFFCCYIFMPSVVQAAGGGSYSNGNYSRRSTDAQRSTMPKTGRGATSLSTSNPYEKRKVDLLLQEEKYQAALRRWEAKVAHQEVKDRQKREAAESKRQAALQAEKNRKMKEAARLAQQGSKESKFNLFGNSSVKIPTKPTPTPQVITDSAQASYQQEKELELPKPSAVQQQEVASAPQAKVSEEPGFFTKLKWALFGK